MQSIEFERRSPTLVCLIISVAMAFAFATSAEEISLGEKPLPKPDDVVNMFGQSLATIFEKFGAPNDLTVEDPKSKSPGVNFDYGKFGFVVHDKKVTMCFFWGAWKEPVLGVKIGSTADEIVKALGKPNLDITNANGTSMMTWNRADGKSKVSITFDKNHTSDGLYLELK